MEQQDESNTRAPNVGDPWPGGMLQGTCRCWCGVCRGQHLRMRHRHDAHMFINGIWTSEGVVDVTNFFSQQQHDRGQEDGPNMDIEENVNNLSIESDEVPGDEYFYQSPPHPVHETMDAIHNEADGQSDDSSDLPDDSFIPPYNGDGQSDNSSDLPDDISIPLYNGARTSRGRFALNMLKIKATHNLPTNAMDEIYKLVKKALPQGNTAPSSTFVANKVVGTIGLDYQLIHACPNHHILYRGVYKDATHCPECNEPRLKPNSDQPQQVLRYFPLIDRLVLAYKNPELAKLYQWHHENRSPENMSGPCDGSGWPDITSKHECELNDPRTLRLGLAMDGVSPFTNGGHSTPYSVWPLVMTTYNLPPWLATKDGFSWVVMILPGPNQIPPEYLDVYLEPLYEELMKLWRGVPAIDGSNANQSFLLRAILLNTMHDWPGYAYCSGLTTSGLHGCPMCHDSVASSYDPDVKTMLYGRHRHFLPQNHAMRYDTNHWWGRTEHDVAPTWPGGDDWLDRCEEVNDGLMPQEISGMKRLAIWQKLPYFKDIKSPHLMDPMHIKANVAKNLCQTFFAFKAKNGTKSKDSIGVRLSCESHMVHPTAWMIPGRNDPPPAPWIFITAEKRIFMKRLSNLCFPTGYGAGFKKSFSGKFPKELKSHDYHCLMQHGFPIAIRGLLTEEIREAVYLLSSVFRRLCQSVIVVADLDDLEEDAAVAISSLEKVLPPAFFVSQVHLVVHLVQEIRIWGPFPPRWMYPWERRMGKMKGKVRNRSRPEASMAEGQLINELVFHSTLSSNHNALALVWSLQDVIEKESKVEVKGVGLPYKWQSRREEKQAHMYVLKHSTFLSDWWKRYEDFCEQRREARRSFRESFLQMPFPEGLRSPPEFDEWLKDTLARETCNDPLVVAIAIGRTSAPLSYKHMVAGGRHYKTKQYDDTIQGTCDTFVVGTFAQQSVASRGDENPVGQELTYVGYISEIILYVYADTVRVILLKNRWYKPVVHEDLHYGVVMTSQNAIIPRDESGFHTVDTSSFCRREDEPFVLVEHVAQCLLAPVDEDSTWAFAIPTPSRFSRIEAVVDEEPTAVWNEVDEEGLATEGDQ